MDIIEHIKNTIQTERISVLYLNFVDLEGEIRSKGMFTCELLKNLEGFFKDGISVTGNLKNARDEENSFFIIRPIAETFTTIRWTSYGTEKPAFVLCEVINSSLDCRSVVSKLTRTMKNKQIKPMSGLGLTYQIDGLSIAEKQAGYYKCFPGSKMNIFNNELASTLLNSGIELEYSVPSGPDCQHLALVPKDLLKSMDSYALGKWITSSFALSKGHNVGFIKPFENSAPLHLSIWDENEKCNLFYDPQEQYEFSQKGYSFIAGVLKYFDEIFAIIAAVNGAMPKVNYTKTYSYLDDNSVISAPCYFLENGKIVHSGWGKRCVFRGIGCNANLYLVTSSIFAAGFEGIQNEYSVDQFTNKSYGVHSSSLSEKKHKLLECSLFSDLFGSSIMNVFEENLSNEMKRMKK